MGFALPSNRGSCIRNSGVARVRCCFRMIFADVISQDGKELFGAATLVSLQMSDHDEFAFRSASCEAQVGKCVAVLGQTVDLRQD